MCRKIKNMANKTNITNTIVGVSGWLLSNIPNMIESISGIITVVTSIMGVVMLTISIRTGIVNYRMKKIEYRKAKRQEEDNS